MGPDVEYPRIDNQMTVEYCITQCRQQAKKYLNPEFTHLMFDTAFHLEFLSSQLNDERNRHAELQGRCFDTDNGLSIFEKLNVILINALHEQAELRNTICQLEIKHDVACSSLTLCQENRDAAQRALSLMCDRNKKLLDSYDREKLGQIVRQVWIEWAKEQPNPKYSWLKTWDSLTEPEKEVDRRIGETIWKMALM